MKTLNNSGEGSGQDAIVEKGTDDRLVLLRITRSAELGVCYIHVCCNNYNDCWKCIVQGVRSILLDRRLFTKNPAK